MKIPSLIASLSLAACLAPANAQDPAAFYRGRTVSLQVGSAAGDGYDQYARVIARHIGKYIPGQPNIIVQNVPGGGSLLLANQFGNTTPRDGSVFGIFNNGMPTTPLLNPSVAKFDPRRFAFIGSPSREVQAFVSWHESPARTFADLFSKEIIVGGSAPGAATWDYPLLTNALIGTRFRVVTGYAGTADQILAMQRGELHANPAVAWVTMKTQHAARIADKTMLVLGQYGFRPHRDMPDVPLFPTGKTDDERAMFALMYARQDYGRPVLAPPDVPADRVAALRTAFDAALGDPELHADAGRLGLDLEPLKGADLQALTARLFDTPAAVVDQLQRLLGTRRQ